MEKAGFLSLSFFLLLIYFLKAPVFAENITTGNASAKSSVETIIEGNGNVTTHIEVTANGEKKVLDANKPGEYKLEVNSNDNSKNKTPNLSTSPTKTSTPTPTVKPDKPGRIFDFSIILKNISDFLKRIFSVF